MAYKLINETYCPYSNACRKEFICDTDADFTNLPESCVGSTAVSIESGKVMVVNTEGNWVPFANSGNGGGGGSAGTAALAYYVSGVDELPADAVDGSLAVVESDSLIGEWEWKDNESPLDLSMFNVPTNIVSVDISTIGHDELAGIISHIVFLFEDSQITTIYYTGSVETLLYVDNSFDDSYSKFEFFSEIDLLEANVKVEGQNKVEVAPPYFTADDFKTFIKTNCNRLSGGHALYSRENGEWVSKGEI